jgi:hypothetical protein
MHSRPCEQYLACICCACVNPDTVPEVPPASGIAHRADDDGREPGEILQSAATVVQRAAAAVLSGSSTDTAAAHNPKMRVRSLVPEPTGADRPDPVLHPSAFYITSSSLPFVPNEALVKFE